MLGEGGGGGNGREGDPEASTVRVPLCKNTTLEFAMKYFFTMFEKQLQTFGIVFIFSKLLISLSTLAF